MMQLRVLLFLLHIHLETCCSLPAPSSVSISSSNMQHVLSFLPGPRTPINTSFSVEVIHSRKSLWRPVAACSQLMAGQTCDLTRVFQDPYAYYQTRVQAVTSMHRSIWTASTWFQPLSDTVLEPPNVTVSGCGNCLIVQLTVPSRELQQNLQLKDLYKEIFFLVRRTRDGAQFTLSLPYKDENVIQYLQPGVEYCVTVSAKGLFTTKSVSSEAYCAFTSPPPPSHFNALNVAFGLLAVFCVLGLPFIGLMLYGGRLSLELITQRLPLRNVSNICCKEGDDCGLVLS
ncbi:interferon alpha/beta receptor 2-like isoform X2 [Betta splendens]|uniref:Interferon alpha/beta receptor 2-like isoform X2 n=1 Tax=Betta splendens TaxID=158456 RepID=A0A8M1H876_BETSP|nr:interferon alpha/beta receptor 2-like isoform X2 [Betta splendens]